MFYLLIFLQCYCRLLKHMLNNFFENFFQNLIFNFTPCSDEKDLDSLTRITELTWRNVRGAGLPCYSLIPRSE